MNATDTPLKAECPPLGTKLGLAACTYGFKSTLALLARFRDWKEYFYPPEGGPDLVKRYEVRPHLPIRIFFPKSYDQNSGQVLPALFTIHGGGFVSGAPRDDDEWNRRFADRHRTLVVSLNYSKALQHPFPAGLHDVEALLLACLADEALPIDRSSSSGRSLSKTALGSVRRHAHAPPAVVSVYGNLDLAVPPAEKLRNRPFKPSLPPTRDLGISVGGGGKEARAAEQQQQQQQQQTDPLAGLLPLFAWSYVPYGVDLRDPLVSPARLVEAPHRRVAAETALPLPPFVGVVAAELDMLAHDSWRLACGLSRRRRGRGRVPDRLSADEAERVCGRREVGRRMGALEEDVNDERFGFEEAWEDGGVKWLLVPDVLHGFDNPHSRRLMGGGDVTMRDAEMKTRAYMDEMGSWLRERVWRI